MTRNLEEFGDTFGKPSFGSATSEEFLLLFVDLLTFALTLVQAFAAYTVQQQQVQM